MRWVINTWIILRVAIGPIGSILLLLCFGIERQCVRDLVLGSQCIGESQISPDSPEQCFDRAILNDFDPIGIQNITGGYIDLNITRCRNQLESQVAISLLKEDITGGCLDIRLVLRLNS